MKRLGFSLVELAVTAAILTILATLAVVRYAAVAEKSRGTEAELVLEKVRAGYQAALFEQALPGGWAPGIPAATDGSWRAVGMSNPNAAANSFFAYLLQGGNLMYAYRRNTQVAYSASYDAARWLFMNLDTGQITRSAAYQ